MKNYQRTITVVAVAILIAPQFAFASWWNPFTWNIFSFLFHAEPQMETINPTSNSGATSRLVNTTPADTIIASTTEEKSSIEATTSIKTVTKTLAPAPTSVVKKSPQVTQPTGTLCNGTYWDACTAEQDFICPLIGNAFCQPHVQPVQLVGQQATSASSSTTVAKTDKGIPYKGQDGNWYYPNAYSPDGKLLKAPSSLISGESSWSPDTLTIATEYKTLSLLTLNITGTSKVSNLKSVTVHFSTNGAKVTNAYLYQGTSLPIASTVVSGNMASFIIPDNTAGASFGANIQTQFTVKVDIKGLQTEEVYHPLCYAKMPLSCMRGIVPKTNPPIEAFVPASVGARIASSDVQIKDEFNDPVVIEGSATGAFQTPVADTNGCFDPCFTDTGVSI